MAVIVEYIRNQYLYSSGLSQAAFKAVQGYRFKDQVFDGIQPMAFVSPKYTFWAAGPQA